MARTLECSVGQVDPWYRHEMPGRFATTAIASHVARLESARARLPVPLRRIGQSASCPTIGIFARERVAAGSALFSLQVNLGLRDG